MNTADVPDALDPPEEMAAFFTSRVTEYDSHMLVHVEGMADVYGRVASLLPHGIRTLLDLGCGTGLELDGIFARFPRLAVTGIDMTRAMLDECAGKHGSRALTLLCGSYFDLDFGRARFDAALSVQTLHHFTHEEKRGLYRRVLRSLTPGGWYIEADYVASSLAEEESFFARRARLLARACAGSGLWHIDTPCTVENQARLLKESGFQVVELDAKIGNTAILVAKR